MYSVRGGKVGSEGSSSTTRQVVVVMYGIGIGMGCYVALLQSTPTARYIHTCEATPRPRPRPHAPAHPSRRPWLDLGGYSGSLGPLDLDLGRLNQSSVRHLLPYPALCMALEGQRNTRTETRSGCWLWVMTAWTAWLRRGLRRGPRLSYRNECKNGCRRCSCFRVRSVPECVTCGGSVTDGQRDRRWRTARHRLVVSK